MSLYPVAVVVVAVVVEKNILESESAAIVMVL